MSKYSKFYPANRERARRKRTGIDWLVRKAYGYTIIELEESYYQYLDSVLGFTINSSAYPKVLKKRIGQKGWKYDFSAENKFIYEEDIRLALYKNLEKVANDWYNSPSLSKVFVHGQHQQHLGKEVVFPDLIVWRMRKNSGASGRFEKIAIEIKQRCGEKEWERIRPDLMKLNGLVNKFDYNSVYFVCISTSEKLNEKIERHVKTNYRLKKRIEPLVYLPSAIKNSLPDDPYFLLRYKQDLRPSCLALERVRTKIREEFSEQIQVSTNKLSKDKYGSYFHIKKSGIIDYLQITRKNGGYFAFGGKWRYLPVELKKKLERNGFTLIEISKPKDIKVGVNEKCSEFILVHKKKLDSIEDCMDFSDEIFKKFTKLMKVI